MHIQLKHFKNVAEISYSFNYSEKITDRIGKSTQKTKYIWETCQLNVVGVADIIESSNREVFEREY